MENGEQNYIGETIERFRLQRGMSIRSLADSVSMQEEALFLSLLGKRKLTATELIKIMQTLKMSFKDFNLPA